MSLFTDFWTAYNAPDTLLPLYLPLTVWVGGFVYCKFATKTPTNFHEWAALHSVHNYGVILLGQISMYTANDDIFRERIVTLFTTGYFMVDLVDCALRLDGAYTFHAVTSLFLCFANYFTPLCQELRMTSKAGLLEASTPFLYLAKKTRKPEHFGLFALVFTACRILWVPFMMKQLIDGGMGITDPILIVLTGFYGLNLFWWYKILRIIVRGASDAPSSKKDITDNADGGQQVPPNKEKKP